MRLTRNGTANLAVLSSTLSGLAKNEVLDGHIRDKLAQSADIFEALSSPVVTITTAAGSISAGHQETVEERRLRDWLHRIQEASEPGTLVYAAAREALLGSSAPTGVGLKVGNIQ